MLVDALDIVLTLGNDQKMMLNSKTNTGVLNNGLAWFHQAPISWECAIFAREGPKWTSSRSKHQTISDLHSGLLFGGTS